MTLCSGCVRVISRRFQCHKVECFWATSWQNWKWQNKNYMNHISVLGELCIPSCLCVPCGADLPVRRVVIVVQCNLVPQLNSTSGPLGQESIMYLTHLHKRKCAISQIWMKWCFCDQTPWDTCVLRNCIVKTCQSFIVNWQCAADQNFSFII